MPHNHCHDHECNHGSESSNNPLEIGIQYSLYSKIDIENLECLNEEINGSGKLVFKPYEDRCDYSKFVKSDSDAELLFNIPFNGNIKLKGLIIGGPDDESHPSEVRLYKNRPNMSFDDGTIKPDQLFELTKDPLGEIEYLPKIVKFTNVQHLSLYFPANFGENFTKIYYIGLKGEFSEAHRHGVTICNYEALPSVTDNNVDFLKNVKHEI